MKPNELSTAADIQLLDVRLPRDFETAHLDGAQNNCVFEVAFAERLSQTASAPNKTTIVYGANDQSHEAKVAAEKLRRLGFGDVRILEGGIEAAEQADVELIRGAASPPEAAIADGIRNIDLEESRVEWLGRNLINKHWGTVALEAGHLTFEGGILSGGEIVIDLTRLECTDLAGTNLHDVLISHLHNDDFFDVENHPNAKFVITQVEPGLESAPGSPNLKITADLTIRGQTHPIVFTASAGLTEEGKPAAQAAFSIDRTRWDIIYGSGKFFHHLAGHVVNDQLEFQLRIITE